MGFDLISIISIDAYHLLKPIRYTNNNNFKDIYAAFEIFCLLVTVGKWSLDIFRATVIHFLNRHYAVCNTLKVEHSRKKNA